MIHSLRLKPADLLWLRFTGSRRFDTLPPSRGQMAGQLRFTGSRRFDTLGYLTPGQDTALRFTGSRRFDTLAKWDFTANQLAEVYRESSL